MVKKVNNKRKKISRSRKIRFLLSKIFFIINIAILVGAIFICSKLYIEYKDKVNFNLFDKFFSNSQSNKYFVVKNIYIEGKKYTSDKEVLSAVNLKIGDSLFDRSVGDIKNDLEKIEWIRSAVVERNFSGDIYLGIQERVPVALGQFNKKIFLFDIDGEKIYTKKLKDFLHLPIIIGEDINLYVKNLYPIIVQNIELYKKITSIQRVSERRWNIIFDNGLEVKLPANDISNAWSKIIKLYDNKKLFDDNIIAIDLRVKNRVIIEKKK
jgi:cell division protein FtsQ